MTENIRRLKEKRGEAERSAPLARKRLSMLFDGGFFTEFNMFMSSDDLSSEGIICGYGALCGVPVFAYAQDPNISGGAFGKVQGKKIKFIYEKACRLGVPIIALLDCRGIRLNEGLSGFSALGEIYAQMSKASGIVPQIALILGNTMGSMSLIPALSDFSFALTESKVFMSSPQTKTNSEKSSGNTFVNKKFEKEEEMFDFVRRLISFLPRNNTDVNFSNISQDAPHIPELNENIYETKDILSLISDKKDFAEIFGNSVLTLGFSRLGGQSVAAIGFSGADADSKSLEKCAEFVSFADAFSIPVVSLTNLSGFSSEDSDADIVKATAKLIHAFTNASVPKINVITEKLTGSPLLFANSEMLGADMVYLWADAQVGLMDSEAAVNVMEASDFIGAKDVEALKNKKISEYKKTNLDSFEAAKSGFAHDIIEPAETRAAILSALSLFYTKSEKAVPLKKHSAKKI